MCTSLVSTIVYWLTRFLDPGGMSLHTSARLARLDLATPPCSRPGWHASSSLSHQSLRGVLEPHTVDIANLPPEHTPTAGIGTQCDSRSPHRRDRRLTQNDRVLCGELFSWHTKQAMLSIASCAVRAADGYTSRRSNSKIANKCPLTP